MDIGFGQITPYDEEVVSAALRELRTDAQALRAVDKRDLSQLEKSISTFDAWEPLFSSLSTGGQVSALMLVARQLLPLEAEATVHDGDLEMEEMEKLVVGNFHVRGNLLNAGALIVLGDLTVDGSYVERPLGMTCLGVGGDLRVGNLITTQSLSVLGSLEAKELVAGFEGEGELSVEHRLSATMIWQEGREFRYAELETGEFFPTGIPDGEHSRVFDAACLDGDKADRRLIELRALGGEPVLGADSTTRKQISARVANLLTMIGNGGSFSFTTVMERSAVRIELADGSRQISFIDEIERAMLEAFATPSS